MKHIVPYNLFEYKEVKQKRAIIYQDMEPDEMVDLINTNCQPWIDYCKDFGIDWLYRGIKPYKITDEWGDKWKDRNRVNASDVGYDKYIEFINKAQMLKLKRINNRKPVDTSQFLHNQVDDALNDKFGWRPRSEGVFIMKKETTSYGEPFYFFPIGEFKYVYSTEIEDLYSDVGEDPTNPLAYDDQNRYAHDMIALHDEEFTKDNLSKYALYWLNNYQYKINQLVDTYKDTGMQDLANTMKEIIFDVKEYYMIDTDYEHIQDFKTMFRMIVSGDFE